MGLNAGTKLLTIVLDTDSAWVNFGSSLEKATVQGGYSGGLGKGSLKRVFSENNLEVSDVVSDSLTAN